MRVKLSDISNDTSIQCRSRIEIEVICDYAERMTDSDVFPPVTLFSDGKTYWIADGWHRVMAAKHIGANDIDADVKHGTRLDALKVALKANSVHGLRRSNEDKRRCVQVACAEFPFNSNRQIAVMCGVSDTFVNKIRPVLQTVCNTPEPTKRTGSDGRQYNTHKPPRPPATGVMARILAPYADRPVTPAPTGQPPASIPRPAWLPPDDDDTPIVPTTAHEPQERDEPEYSPSAPTNDNAPKETDSVTLYHLKRYWNMADRNERNAFVLWVKANKEG